ncbi:MAG TPA: hypothetical protein VMD92_15580 [Acidobacteriaceae bacterium]|nr:hypothetical protein [Acidobacteriaceae bacterium]
MVAGIRLFAGDPMMQTLFVAKRADSTRTGKTLLHEPNQAGVIIGKQRVELVESKASFWRNGLWDVHSKTSAPHFLPYIKGYLPSPECQTPSAARRFATSCRPPAVFPTFRLIFRNCQEFGLRTKVMTPENKPLPRQNTPTNLTGLDPPVWYSELKIEKKKKARSPAGFFLLGETP